MTVPGVCSRSFAVASAPERSLQSAMSPAPTRTAAWPSAGVAGKAGGGVVGEFTGKLAGEVTDEAARGFAPFLAKKIGRSAEHKMAATIQIDFIPTLIRV